MAIDMHQLVADVQAYYYYYYCCCRLDCLRPVSTEPMAEVNAVEVSPRVAET